MPNIRHEVLIAAPAKKIYAALTTPEGLSAWWTPNTKAKPEENSIANFPFGSSYHKEMKITELTPAKRVQWICLAGEDQWVGTTFSFELYSDDKETLLKSHPEIAGQIQQIGNVDEATLLVFHQDGWKAETPMFGECNYTWGQFLRSLKLLCETGKGQPWPHQHQTRS